MTDKVQKIKEWISKEQDGLMDAQGNFEYPEHEGAYHILCNLDTYIDSLQEEPVSIWHDASKKSDNPEDVVIINPYDNTGEVLTKCTGVNQGHIWAYTSELLKLDNLCNIEKNLQEEPVSEEWIKELRTKLDSMSKEDFKKVFDKYAVDFKSEDLEKWAYYNCIDRLNKESIEDFKAGAKWQEEKDNEEKVLTYKRGFEDCKEQMMKNIWKPADGDDLPDIDREVIVLIQPYPLENSEYAVSFAHRPYKGKYIGKSLTTGNIETFENKTYDKGGWNIPNAKYWLDVELPKEIEL
jgi:hypothetical protein